MTKERQEFEYYCLDRLKVLGDDFPLAYSDGAVIRKIFYKIGLKATIKREECFILYTGNEEDYEHFTFIPVDVFFNNQKRFYTEVLSIEEVKELIRKLPAINIFEFTSLLEFNNIYEEFKELLEDNWEMLQMDNLIEI